MPEPVTHSPAAEFQRQPSMRLSEMLRSAEPHQISKARDAFGGVHPYPPTQNCTLPEK